MAVNKVDVNGVTVLDLTQDSVTPDTLKKGETTHDASGALIVGTMETVMIPKTTALLKGDGVGGVSEAVKGTDYAEPSVAFTVTLTTSGWAQSGSYKKQTVTVAGLKASYPVSPVVDAQLSGTDADGDAAILTAFTAVNILQTAENQLIAYCIEAAPTTNIPLIINTWG